MKIKSATAVIKSSFNGKLSKLSIKTISIDRDIRLVSNKFKIRTAAEVKASRVSAYRYLVP